MKYLYVVCCLLMVALCSACYQDRDTLFTSTKCVIDAGDTLKIKKMQASVTFTNLNTNEQVVATTLQKNEVKTTLLQGLYKIYGQGTAQVINQDGKERIVRFRVTKDNLPLTVGENSVVKLQMFFVP